MVGMHQVHVCIMLEGRVLMLLGMELRHAVGRVARAEGGGVNAERVWSLIP